MEAHLSPTAETFLADVVAAGAYRDVDEALEASVDLLRARTELQQRLQNSRAQLDRGEGLSLDDEGLGALFQALRAKTVN
jgi:Arc/MetJ-type ribon-helix-helix transcriptional regulator